MRWPKHISATHRYAVNLDLNSIRLMLSIFKTSLRASACADMLHETQWSSSLWGNAHHEQLIQQGQLCFLESICSVIGNHLSLSITAPSGAPIVFSSQSLLFCIGQLSIALLTFFSTRWALWSIIPVPRCALWSSMEQWVYLVHLGERYGAQHSRGGRCSLFLTMRCFNDAMFSNS